MISVVTDSIWQDVLSQAANFDFEAGDLALDFANTASTHDPPTGDGLTSYVAFVAWAFHARQVDEETAKRLLSNAATGPQSAAKALRRAVSLREAIFRLLANPEGIGNARARDLRAFNRALTDARSRLEVRSHSGVFVWAWRDLGTLLDAPLAPVLEAAAQLLTSPADLARVRRCRGETCDWLFIDRSKNGSRRWCSMSGCGNRAKARRFYQRSKAALN